jgi:hypothetical protein
MIIALFAFQYKARNRLLTHFVPHLLKLLEKVRSCS